MDTESATKSASKARISISAKSVIHPLNGWFCIPSTVLSFYHLKPLYHADCMHKRYLINIQPLQQNNWSTIGKGIESITISKQAFSGKEIADKEKVIHKSDCQYIMRGWIRWAFKGSILEAVVITWLSSKLERTFCKYLKTQIVYKLTVMPNTSNPSAHTSETVRLQAVVVY